MAAEPWEAACLKCESCSMHVSPVGLIACVVTSAAGRPPTRWVLCCINNRHFLLVMLQMSWHGGRSRCHTAWTADCGDVHFTRPELPTTSAPDSTDGLLSFGTSVSPERWTSTATIASRLRELVKRGRLMLSLDCSSRCRSRSRVCIMRGRHQKVISERWSKLICQPLE